MVFTTKYTKGARKRPAPLTKKFAEGGAVPIPEEDPRKEYREARRTLKDPIWKPVTVMEDIVGGFSPSKAQQNALRDAVRRGAVEKIKKSGYED